MQDKDEEAIDHLVNSVLIAEESGDIENKSKAFKALSEAYGKTGDKSQAFSMFLPEPHQRFRVQYAPLAIKTQKSLKTGGFFFPSVIRCTTGL